MSNEAAEQREHEAVLKTVTMTFKVAYKPEVPQEIIEDNRPSVVLHELVSAPVEIVNIESSYEPARIPDDFGLIHYETQTEFANYILAAYFGDCIALDDDE